MASVDSENRLEPPEEARDWFPPGARFLIQKKGDIVTLTPVDDLAAHMDRVRQSGPDEALTLEEIQAEVDAYRSEQAELGRT